MSKSEKEQMAKVFRAFDKEGSGKLTKEDIKTGYLDYFNKVISDEEVNNLFIGSSEHISFSEFVTATQNE
jgi:Ca2+-binding EF-hand superfamily protein